MTYRKIPDIAIEAVRYGQQISRSAGQQIIGTRANIQPLIVQQLIGQDQVSSLQAFRVLGNRNHVQEEVNKEVSVVWSVRENYCIIIIIIVIIFTHTPTRMSGQIGMAISQARVT
jgi:hypothetical protein